MDEFFERLLVRAATIDELLSDDFEALPGRKGDADLAARRLAAWCRACASGDWAAFERRLQRDGLSMARVLARLATVRRSALTTMPAWIADAIWIDGALQSTARGGESDHADRAEPCAFEHVLDSVIEAAWQKLREALDDRVLGNLTGRACASLRHMLRKELSLLCAPALYECFVRARKHAVPPTCAATGASQYQEFVAAMRAGGWRELFEDKPVLLRLMALLTRQWLDVSHELMVRLDADLAAIRRALMRPGTHGRIAAIHGDLSDPHNDGRSVRIVTFEDGAAVVYKPKDLRVDVCWHDLVERLNKARPPVELKAVRVLARDGYGWTELIEHAGCVGRQEFNEFFRRAGAWLALFHCFAANDMHQENMMAIGNDPVPIDLETILQGPSGLHEARDAEGQAFALATETIANSVSMVGLLPAYGRSPENDVFAMGGMIHNQTAAARRGWESINSDTMRPRKFMEAAAATSNLPHVDGEHARLGDYLDDFVSGFEDYAGFLRRESAAGRVELFEGFAGLPVRRIVRPTRFYSMLLQRLRDHRTMSDGVVWSAQIDFIARLADWDSDADPLWPLQRAERSALARLNVPHFVGAGDGHEVCDATGTSMHTDATTGLERARTRMRALSEREIAWQVEVIRQNTAALSKSAGRPLQAAAARRILLGEGAGKSRRELFMLEADRIAAEVASLALRRSPGAAWIGVDWLGDSEVSQLVALGPDFYNGSSGVAVFLAAHAATRSGTPAGDASGELALAAIVDVRKKLRSRGAARLARSLGVGAGTGVGSLVYALTLMSRFLQEDALLADAHAAAELITDDLIAADRLLDVIGGSAGAILCLLRLYRDTGSRDALRRAMRCGEHLLGQARQGAQGARSWKGGGGGTQPLNGMSHGAAGFAYALASLCEATGRGEFLEAARECVVYEDSGYDAERHNWPDLRVPGATAWPAQWCHGAVGIGLARMGMTRCAGVDRALLERDIERALKGAERAWPNAVDTLCCGTLASIELLHEAAAALGGSELRETAAQRLMAVVETATASGDYCWNVGQRRFSLSLFRGLAGVGYTLLRRLHGSLPNVLVWE